MSDPVQRLIDIEEIKGLKARYFRSLDTKDWEAFGQVFTRDAHMEVPEGGLSEDGREAIVLSVSTALVGTTTVQPPHLAARLRRRGSMRRKCRSQVSPERASRTLTSRVTERELIWGRWQLRSVEHRTESGMSRLDRPREARYGALGALLAAAMVLAACGDDGAEQVAIDAGSSGAAGSASAATNTDFDSALYYLPVYQNGAVYAGTSEDRVADAEASLTLWREVEQAQPAGSDVGERDAQARLDSMQESLGLTDEEFERQVLDQTEAALEARVPEMELTEAPSTTTVQPVYAELADLCGDGGSVVVYASSSTATEPALDQYTTVVPTAAEDLPEGVEQAWQLDPEDGFGAHAWRPVPTPEVLVVAVSVDPTCTLADLAGQVSIERGE